MTLLNEAFQQFHKLKTKLVKYTAAVFCQHAPLQISPLLQRNLYGLFSRCSTFTTWNCPTLSVSRSLSDNSWWPPSCTELTLVRLPALTHQEAQRVINLFIFIPSCFSISLLPRLVGIIHNSHSFHKKAHTKNLMNYRTIVWQVWLSGQILEAKKWIIYSVTMNHK